MKATKAELANEVTKLRNIGAQMANACFNLSQADNMHPDDKRTLATLSRQWDQIPRSAR